MHEMQTCSIVSSEGCEAMLSCTRWQSGVPAAAWPGLGLYDGRAGKACTRISCFVVAAIYIPTIYTPILKRDPIRSSNLLTFSLVPSFYSIPPSLH